MIYHLMGTYKSNNGAQEKVIRGGMGSGHYQQSETYQHTQGHFTMDKTIS